MLLCNNVIYFMREKVVFLTQTAVLATVIRSLSNQSPERVGDVRHAAFNF